MTFTEHLYCRMIDLHRAPDPRMTALADKLRAREYVAACVGSSYLPFLHWSGADPAQIPFGYLPDRYVVKTNHGSGQVIRVDGEVDRAEAVRQLTDWLSRSWYWVSREYQYLGIEPRVLVEEWLDDGYPEGPLDYRVHCFHGRPALIQVSDYPHVVHQFYDPTWRRVDVRTREARGDYDVAFPERLDEMMEVAARLSRGFDFIRVDLFHLSGRVLVGELTFTPNAGYRPFEPASVERELGRAWAGTTTEPSLPLA